MGGKPRVRTAPDGIVVIDKPSGMTSHDVVSRMRRVLGTRAIGHAGTLDPMATGVLIIGCERATKLLGHLALTRKTYAATLRLGVTTVTEDAEGEETGRTSAAHLTEAQIRAAAARFVGEIQQRPSAVSAIKVDGVRSYARVRAGEDVELPARPVTIHALEIMGVRPHDEAIDVDFVVSCSSGTYVRALARDVGERLGVGAHLTALRRTAVGNYTLADAISLPEVGDEVPLVPLVEVLRREFAVVQLTPAETARVRNGARIPVTGAAPSGLVGLVADSGELVALSETLHEGGLAVWRHHAVFSA